MRLDEGPMSGNEERRGSRPEPRGQVDVEKMAKETEKEQPVRGEEKSECRVEECWERKCFQKEGAMIPAKCCCWFKFNEAGESQLYW